MRKTIAELANGFYNYGSHCDLSDRKARRYHPFSFDFDSTPEDLKKPDENWDENVKRHHIERRTKQIANLKLEYGTRRIDQTVRDITDLGPKAMSLITHHNALHQQVRRSFVTGAYYPALLSACALGERILNHLILDLRDEFKSSEHYKKVHKKASFDDWRFIITVLTDWEVLANSVGADFRALGKLRNQSIHFNPNTYETLREDALLALKQLNNIISKQFGYYGRQPWFIEGTPGAQFVKRGYESNPFVRKYIIPRSGFVGPYYGMDLSPEGVWRHLDYSDYGDDDLTDEQFAKCYKERDPRRVVSRAMIEEQQKDA